MKKTISFLLAFLMILGIMGNPVSAISDRSSDEVHVESLSTADYTCVSVIGSMSWWSEDDLMTEIAEDVYSLTLFLEPNCYECKIRVDNSWAINWGGEFTGFGQEFDLYLNEANITFDVEAACNVNFLLDLTAFDGTYGAKCTISVDESSCGGGHSYDAVVTAPSCTAEGYTTYTCTVCGDSYVDNYTYLPHNYVDGICTVCGKAEREILDSGTCGTNVSWSLTDDGVLTISGTGDMYDYAWGSAPWYDYCFDITAVVIEDGVTGIGSYAFADCEFLFCITIPDSVTRVGNYVFSYLYNQLVVLYEGTETQWNAISFGSGNYELEYASPCFNYVAGENATIASGYVGDDITWTLDLEGTLTFSGTGAMYELDTDYEGDYEWIYYGTNSDWNNVFIKKVLIEDGITSIGNYAFIGCAALTSVTIPDSVTRISTGAFNGCESLQYNVYEGSQYLGNAENPYVALIHGGSSSVIHENTKIIMSRAYANSAVTTITIPASVGYIGDFAFQNCGSLQFIQVDPNNPNYSSDDSGVFFDKAKTVLLQAPGAISGSYTIPDGVTRVFISAFSNCQYLQSVTIPDSVTMILNSAFSGCTSLSEVSFGSGLTRLGDYVFANCTSLPYTEHDAVRYLGDANNPYLILVEVMDTSILSCTIPEGTKFIMDFAFADCDDMTTVTIPSSIHQIGCEAFACDSLWHILYRGTEEQGSKISFCDEYHGGGFVCEDHHFAAFFSGWADELCDYNEHCIYKDTVLHFNATGEEVTDPVGKYCTICDGPVEPEEPSGTCGDNLTWTLTEDGTLTISGSGEMEYYTEGTTPWYLYCDEITAVVIEDGVTGIGNSAFYGCSSLTSVTIPDSVTSIGERAFFGCTSLTAITIPDGVTDIRYAVFYNCTSLAAITIGDGVTSIGRYALYGCKSLVGLTIPDSVTSIGEYAFSNCFSIADVTIPDGVTFLDDGVFAGCLGLTSVTIPDGVTHIGDRVFWSCTSLVSILIPDGVTFIGEYAFQDCSSLTSITIPEGVTCIGAGMFQNCTSLASIAVPDGVTRIDEYAFYYCPSLTNITIPEGVTRIGDWAFSYCYGLTSITLPASLTRINAFAFDGCESLWHVLYKGTEADWDAVFIDDYNDVLMSATRHYECTGDEIVDGVCTICDPSGDHILGDVNGDGTVNYLDAMLIAQYYVGDIEDGDFNLDAADVNGDGIVNYLDAMMVAQYYVGDIESFLTED